MRFLLTNLWWFLNQYLSLFEIGLFFNFWKIDIFELFFIFFHDLHLIFLIENRFLRCSAINLLAKNFLLTFFVFIDFFFFIRVILLLARWWPSNIVLKYRFFKNLYVHIVLMNRYSCWRRYLITNLFCDFYHIRLRWTQLLFLFFIVQRVFIFFYFNYLGTFIYT